MVKHFFLQVLFIFASAALLFVCAQETPQAPPPENQPLQEAPQPEKPTPKQIPEEKRANENLDIVFVIDSSKSMTYTDPEEFRKVAVKAFLDITQDRGGDRIAVFQFAGWNETETQGAVVFPLTEIPIDEEEREKVIKEAKEAIKTKITPFGKATDFNYAFQKCVLEIIERRKQENATNNLWVLLLTDGEMEVVEPTVRQEYKDKAAQAGAKINRETLNKAATELFDAEVIPLLAAEKNLFITCINLSSSQSNLLKTISEKTPCVLLSTTKERLKGVFVEALARLPEGFYRETLSRGFSYTCGQVEPAAEFSGAFHIYEGAEVTHLLIFAGNSSFSVDVLDPGNNSIISSSNVRVAGEGEIYRAITLKDCPVGDYSVVCKNESESAALFEKILYAQFDFQRYVDVSKVMERYEPGQEIILQLGLRKANRFAKDPLLISDSDIIIEPVAPQGVSPTPTTYSFADEPEARKDIAYKIDEKSIGGEWGFNISFGVIKKQTLTGKYAYTSPPVRVSTTIISPIIEVRFAEKEAFTGQKIPVTGRVILGSLSESDIAQAPFTLTALNETSGKTIDADLNYSAESGTFSANISLPESGKWKLKETPANFGKIVSPPDCAISVNDRSIRIFKIVDNKRQPISEIAVTAKDGFLGESIIVQPDLAPAEAAEVSLTYNAARGKEHTATFTVDKTEAKEAKYNITGKTPDKLVSVKVFRPPPGGRETVGSVMVTCKLPDTEAPLAKEISVICIPAEEGFPLWALLSVCAGAVVILLLLRWYLTLPKFTGQQLILRNWTPYLLRDMRVGRRTAVGTEQLPGSLLFKLRGFKSFPRCTVLPKRNFILFVEGGLKSAWTALTHGCKISVQTADGREKFNYKYFDRPPTAEELETVPEGVLLSEDDFILAEDEDLMGKKEEVIPFARAIEKEKAAAAAAPTAAPPPTTILPIEEPTEILAETTLEEEQRPAEPAEELISELTEILIEEGEEPQIEPTLPGAAEGAATEPTQILAGEEPAKEEAALEKELAEAFKELEELEEPTEPSKLPEAEEKAAEEITQARESALEREGGETRPSAEESITEKEKEKAEEILLEEELEKTFGELLEEEDKEEQK